MTSSCFCPLCLLFDWRGIWDLRYFFILLHGDLVFSSFFLWCLVVWLRAGGLVLLGIGHQEGPLGEYVSRLLMMLLSSEIRIGTRFARRARCCDAVLLL